MRRAVEVSIASIALVGGVASLLVPPLVYASIVSEAFKAFEKGVLSLCAVLVAQAAIYSSIIPPTLVTITLTMWCCSMSIAMRKENQLMTTLVILAALLAAFQSCYYAISIASSRELLSELAIRVSKIIDHGVAEAYGYATQLAMALGALCSSPSAVLGAALFGLSLLDRKVCMLGPRLRIVALVTCAICIARTVVSLYTPSLTPLVTTLCALASITLGTIHVLKCLRA